MYLYGLWVADAYPQQKRVLPNPVEQKLDSARKPGTDTKTEKNPMFSTVGEGELSRKKGLDYKNFQFYFM
ncbi:hypothetical protein CUU66_04235 [Peribacillus deserti]|uniref:Uncharacterized protein n=1 Tax=Peribacillus deserti TaxID=673318 RepID=A0A2N5M9J1_9BACI|nr:hypothetical protein CUU66_04235 [Peribacillus deserti]